jgi:hypothetical protein
MTFSKGFIVVDALDELLERDQGYLVSHLRSPASNVNLMFTSRHLPCIENLFQGAKRLYIGANSDDIRKYVGDRFLREPRLMLLANMDGTLQECVENKVTENVQGMWVSLV